jgi:hypothetical protein
MWGGGVFVLWALLLNWKIGLPAGYDLLRLDPGNGWWLLNWGRNLVYTTEATYHALVAVAWLGVLRHNWRIALAAAAALASTHPYTAVQLLSILGVWCVLRFLAPPPARVPLWFCIAIIALMAGVLSYNLLYLRQFESHRELMKQVTQGWEISVGSLLTSVLPVAFLAIVRIVRDYRNLDERVYFLLICFSVSFLLANHEWFLPPMQPIHFTRGYTWIPLCLIGLPALQDAIAWLHQRINRPAFMEFGIELPKTALIVVCILDWVVRCAPFACMGLILVSDNLAFVWQYKQHRDEYGFYLTPGERDLLEELNRRHLRGILISSDPKLSYLVATYTGARPYYGHLYHTPDYGRRHGEAVALLQQGKPGPWFDRIDLIALRSEQPVMWPDRDQWRLVSSNDEWVLYKRMR